MGFDPRMSGVRWRRRLSDPGVAALLFAVVLGHRGLLWMLFGTTILRVLDNNPHWLTWQYLPIQAYADHFWTAFAYLQQTPPIPHAIVGLLVSIGCDSFSLCRYLVFLQFIITAMTSAILYLLLIKLECRRWLSVILTMLFGLSTDIFLLEINSFGQLFYESGAMLAVTALGMCLSGKTGDARAAPGRRTLLLAGLYTGLGILTRASLCYLAVPVALAVERRWRWRGMLLFLVPVALMQGTWCLKNAAVYHHLTLSTSSWSGINAANGFNFAAGYGSPDGYDSQPFVASILSSPELYPAWLVEVLKASGYADWDTRSASDYVGEAVRERETAIQAAMGGTNPFSNSITIRLISDQYVRAALRYTLQHPRREIEKIKIGYQLFWQPIADYSGMFMGPLYVPMTHRTLTEGPYVFRSDDAYAALQAPDHSGPMKVRLPTLSLLAVDTISCFAISLLLPFCILADVVARSTGRTALISEQLWTLITIAGYGIAVSTMIDLGENMRFRLAFEPILIAVTWGVGTTSLELVRRLRVSFPSRPRHRSSASESTLTLLPALERRTRGIAGMS